MSATVTTPVEDLKAQHEAAKSHLKDVRANEKLGAASADDVATAKREVDRLYAAVRRAAKGTPVEAAKDEKAVATAAKDQADAAEAERSKPGRKVRMTAPVPFKRRIEKNETPESLTRQQKGVAHRVTRKNRLTGLHFSVYDATMDDRFDESIARFVLVCEETGEGVYLPRWSIQGELMMHPEQWLSETTIKRAKKRLEKAA